MNYHGGDIYPYGLDLIDFSSNINPLGVPESFKKAITEDLSYLTRYPDKEYRKLKSAIHEYLQLNETESKIVLGNGAIEVIYKTIQTLPVKKIIIVSPTFSEYRRAGTQAGIKVEEPVLFDENGRFLTEEILQYITDEVLVILCNPNNPTGTLIPKEEIIRMLETLKKRNSFMILDETFIEFTTDYPKTSMTDISSDNLIIIRALTKYFGMPGIRLGYGVFRNSLLGKMVEESMEPWHINAFADLAGTIVLKDKAYIEKSGKWIMRERKRFMSGLHELKDFSFLPTESNFILMTSKKYDAQCIHDILLEKGILVRLPIGFTGLSKYDFRIAIKDRESNNRLLQELINIEKE